MRRARIASDTSRRAFEGTSPSCMHNSKSSGSRRCESKSTFVGLFLKPTTVALRQYSLLSHTRKTRPTSSLVAVAHTRLVEARRSISSRLIWARIISTTSGEPATAELTLAERRGVTTSWSTRWTSEWTSTAPPRVRRYAAVAATVILAFGAMDVDSMVPWYTGRSLVEPLCRLRPTKPCRTASKFHLGLSDG